MEDKVRDDNYLKNQIKLFSIYVIIMPVAYYVGHFIEQMFFNIIFRLYRGKDTHELSFMSILDTLNYSQGGKVFFLLLGIPLLYLFLIQSREAIGSNNKILAKKPYLIYFFAAPYLLFFCLHWGLPHSLFWYFDAFFGSHTNWNYYLPVLKLDIIVLVFYLILFLYSFYQSKKVVLVVRD